VIALRWWHWADVGLGVATSDRTRLAWVKRAPRATGTRPLLGIHCVVVAEFAMWRASFVGGVRERSWTGWHVNRRTKVSAVAAAHADVDILRAPRSAGALPSFGLRCVLVTHYTLATTTARPSRRRIDWKREGRGAAVGRIIIITTAI
jgi:hypothetical protein